MGADAGNASERAPPPQQPFYMLTDDQFMEWWVLESQGDQPLPEDYVLSVNNALQGHLESPRLWEKYIDNIITQQLKFTATTHERCLYRHTDPKTNTPELLFRQVDDFSVSAISKEACMAIIAAIGKFLKVPLNNLGIMRKFNGVNIIQTRWYIKISCQDYLLKILMAHDWLDLKSSRQPIPMRSNSTYQHQLELAEQPSNQTAQHTIQEQAGFSYRTVIGKWIYALVIARPEISMATTKLSQYGSNPAYIHYLYKAVRAIFAFLNNTREDRLIF